MAYSRINLLLIWAVSSALVPCKECQITSLLKNITETSKATQLTVEKMENNLTRAINALVLSQTRMADTLDQIAKILQIQNQQSFNILKQLGGSHNFEFLLKDEPYELEAEIQPPRKENTSSLSLQSSNTTRFPKDCSSIAAEDNHGSGIYTIDLGDDISSLQVYCDMETDGGGWIVFQRRLNGSVNFFRNWKDYVNGFSNLTGEHWLGLEKVHRLTNSGQWTLRIDMEIFNDSPGFAQYDAFKIGDAVSFYNLSIGTYSGTMGFDALAYHNGRPFSTKDQDHDACSFCQSNNGSCSLRYQGAWWYGDCHNTNLNGIYQGSEFMEPNHPSYSIMCWRRFSASGCTALKSSEMKIRLLK